MKAPLILSLLALLCGAAALAAQLVEPRAAAPPEAVAVLPARAAPDAALQARIEVLEGENRRLRDRLAMLETRSEAAARAPVVPGGVATQGELDALREELLAALEGRDARVPAAAPAASPELVEQVASTLSRIRREEALDKARAHQEERLARLEDTLPGIEEWLGLSPYQTGEMRSALLLRYEREADLVRRWEAGEDPAVLGEQKQADRDAHREEVSAFMTPEQLETYTSEGGGK